MSKGSDMHRLSSFALCSLLLISAAAAQQPATPAHTQVDPATAGFDATLAQALGALTKAGAYTLEVDSAWSDQGGSRVGSRYRLASQAGKYRVEIQSHASQQVDLICVNDGAQVTTYYPARKLYSQHAANSPQATLEANKMLALSLQGSALDILLQRDVAHFVHAQASGVKDHGQATLDGKKTRHYELLWAGAKVELWFAAEGEPLLVQFTRTTSVPTANGQHAQTCVGKFQWHLGQKPREGAFTISIPTDAHRVNEIYEALSGEAAVMQHGKSLPKLRLANLDGADVELAAAPDKKATVLIFWATWCAASVEDLPELHKLVTAYKDRGVAFYAVNVGQSPGEVRRFTAKHPLVSTVLLDPRATASSALRINDLPAVAIVAPDNNVRAILHGTAKELQGELTSQLEELLSGRPSSTARRTPDVGPQAK